MRLGLALAATAAVLVTGSAAPASAPAWSVREPTLLRSDLPWPAPGRTAVAVAKPRPLPLRQRCVRRADRATVVRFQAADRVRLIGVMLGKGRAGVVLAHQGRTDLCLWLPYARALAAAGYRALVFDFRRHGSSAWTERNAFRVDLDVAAAVTALRRRGATRVAVAGASLGGIGALVAGPSIRPPVAGIVSLSAPAEFLRGLSPKEAVRRLTVPVLFVAAEGDGAFAEQARTLFQAAGSADKRIQIFPGAEHGVPLLRDRAVHELVTGFLRERLAD